MLSVMLSSLELPGFEENVFPRGLGRGESVHPVPPPGSCPGSAEEGSGALGAPDLCFWPVRDIGWLGGGAEQRSCHPGPRAGQKPPGPYSRTGGAGSKPGWEEGRTFLPSRSLSLCGGDVGTPASHLSASLCCDLPCPLGYGWHGLARVQGEPAASASLGETSGPGVPEAVAGISDGAGGCPEPSLAACLLWVGPPKMRPSQAPLKDAAPTHPRLSPVPQPCPHPSSQADLRASSAGPHPRLVSPDPSQASPGDRDKMPQLLWP